MGPKKEAKITHFERPRNSDLATDVVMIVMTSELSMSWIESDVATLKVYWAILNF